MMTYNLKILNFENLDKKDRSENCTVTLTVRRNVSKFYTLRAEAGEVCSHVAFCKIQVLTNICTFEVAMK